MPQKIAPPLIRWCCAFTVSAWLSVAAAQDSGTDASQVSYQVTVQAGDTAYSIARKAGISVSALMRINGLAQPDLKVGQVLRLREQLMHTVQAGETPYAIARKYGVSVDALLFENLLPPENTMISVGQILKLPAGAKAPARNIPAQAANTQALTTQPVGTGTANQAVPPATATAAARSGTVTTVTTARPASTPPAASQVVLAPPAPFNQPSNVPLPNGIHGSPFLPSAPRQSAPVLSDPDRLPVLQTPAAATQSASPPVSSAPQSSTATVSSPPTPQAEPQVFAPLPSNWREAALAMLGTPYVYGGMSRTGTDCSGLVLQVFGPLGIKLPRVSAQQALVGRAVAAAELLAGDLVFFDTEGRGKVTHVGIYLGDDQFVNANSYQGKVVIDKLMTDRYWSPRFVGARRILGEVIAQR